ncbi:hypothetical protein G5B39_13685 (plasmid) [Rhodobacteraceae bacterium SC52]|nr:hypothetical protein G5B39_13685 [Rhodobacteraceae bacterium SC52]
MGGANQNRYTACFQFKDELMAFNRREKYIIPLVDHAPDDPIDDQRSQGAWNKALNGKPSPDELVEELEKLYSRQRDYPDQFLPKPPPEELIPWMTGLATRDWWANTLEVDKNQMTGWFTGRSKKLDGIVEQRVADWYQRLRDAMVKTSTLTKLGRLGVEKKTCLEHCLRLIEDGEKITDELLKTMAWAWYAEAKIIDWADPKCGYPEVAFDETNRLHMLLYQDSHNWIDEAEADGWEGVRSSLPPDDVWEITEGVEKAWGGKVDDPHGLNKPLYYKRYRASYRLVWDRDLRKYNMKDHHIVSVQDGDVWRNPTEREKAGWDDGAKFFWAELRAERDGTARYTR